MCACGVRGYLVARSASDLRLIIAVHHCRNGAVSLPPKLTR